MDYKEMAKKVGAVLLALIFWQMAAMNIHQKILLVTPLEVIRRLATIWREPKFFSAVWFSFYHIAGGYLLGVAVGILLAVLAAWSKTLETLFFPWMATIKAVPVASFVVICLIWLSARNLSVLIAFLIVLPVVYQNVLTGLRAKDRELEEMASLFAVPWYKKIRCITIPRLRPYLFSACSVTTGMAWKAGIAAEIIGTPNGSMGKMLYGAKIYLDTDDLLAWTVVIVVVSVVSEKLFMGLLKKLLHRE